MNASADIRPTLASLTLELVHRHRLADLEQGLQDWHIRILDAEREVGSLRAARCQYYGADNLAERMTDHGGLCAHAARALLTPDGHSTRDFEAAVEQPGNLLVLDQLRIHDDLVDRTALTVVVADVIDRLSDNGYTVIVPHATSPDADTCEHLLSQAATDLAADAFGDSGLQISTHASPPPNKPPHTPAHAWPPAFSTPTGTSTRTTTQTTPGTRTPTKAPSLPAPGPCCAWRARNCPPWPGRKSPPWAMSRCSAARAACSACSPRSLCDATPSGAGRWRARSTTWPATSASNPKWISRPGARRKRWPCT
ncbi:hypothetical protein ABT160_28325 [Streptomyces sp. NPDC001941]|uniref:hypothetical protein n=1 Tax=Streptomyces sp. NPDC001941 TaxID=3154659 RepID=UPI003332E3AF